MEAVFVETRSFSESLYEKLTDSLYATLQSFLMAHPESGKVIRGTRGLRKMRWADPQRGKGKRGGIRVMYVYLPEVNRFLMLDIYGKDEAEDLTTEERRLLDELAEEYRRQYVGRRRGS
jgi:hypothetical protein